MLLLQGPWPIGKDHQDLPLLLKKWEVRRDEQTHKNYACQYQSEMHFLSGPTKIWEPWLSWIEMWHLQSLRSQIHRWEEHISPLISWVPWVQAEMHFVLWKIQKAKLRLSHLLEALIRKWSRHRRYSNRCWRSLKCMGDDCLRCHKLECNHAHWFRSFGLLSNGDLETLGMERVQILIDGNLLLSWSYPLRNLCFGHPFER
jgi:hypothetical protein